MSNPTPPPTTPDPSASAREWAGLSEKWRGIIDSRLASIVRDLSAFARTCTAVDDGFAKELDAFNAARRVLADAPALLARLEEAERLMREANRVAAKRLRVLDSGGASFRRGEWTDLDAVWCKIDVFLAPSAPRAEGPSRGA